MDDQSIDFAKGIEYFDDTDDEAKRTEEMFSDEAGEVLEAEYNEYIERILESSELSRVSNYKNPTDKQLVLAYDISELLGLDFPTNDSQYNSSDYLMFIQSHIEEFRKLREELCKK